MITLVPMLLGLAVAEPVKPWTAPPTMPPQHIDPPGAKGPRAPPRRIVSLAPSATELVYALGAGARVVGVTRYDDDPPEVKSLPKVGGFLDPNVEAVLALRPDLVLAAPNRENRERIERIAELGVPVLVIPGNALQDLWWATRALAPLLGPPAEAAGEALLSRLEDELVRVRDRPRPGPRRRVAFAYGQEPLVLAGPGSLAHQLLELAQATNVVRIQRAYPVYSVEQLVVDAPELIIDASSAHGHRAEFWTRFRMLDAVRQNRVITLTGTSLMRVGPRIGEALRALADAIDRAPHLEVSSEAQND